MEPNIYSSSTAISRTVTGGNRRGRGRRVDCDCRVWTETAKGVKRASYVLNTANFTNEYSLNLVDIDVLPLKLNLPVAQLFMSQLAHCIQYVARHSLHERRQMTATEVTRCNEVCRFLQTARVSYKKFLLDPNKIKKRARNPRKKI